MLADVLSSGAQEFVPGEIRLRGALNFRDLGGHETEDGKRTRYGRVYRSGDLSHLTATDLAVLTRLGLRSVIDFRPKRDQESRPDRLPRSDSPKVVCLPVGFNPMDPARLRSVILRGRIEDGAFSNLLKEANRAYVTDFREQFSYFLSVLANPRNLPAVFHCTEGKDRTGFAAAIVLLAVGVPFDTILGDYLLTNQRTARSRRWHVLRVLVGTLFRVKPSQMGPLLEARPEYLEAAVEAMIQQSGSIEGYLREALGLTEDVRGSLRAALLE